MRNITARKLCVCAIVAALYAAITILTAPLSYGLVQFRLSEALVVLCAFAPQLGIGITLGCFLANMMSTVTALDMIVGTLATALACRLTARCKKAWQTVVPNVVTNAVLVGIMLGFVLMPDMLPMGFFLCGAQVAFGELIVMVFLGIPLYLFAKRTGFVQKLMGT